MKLPFTTLYIYIFPETGFDISCKLSPLETAEILPRVLSVKIHKYRSRILAVVRRKLSQLNGKFAIVRECPGMFCIIARNLGNKNKPIGVPNSMKVFKV